MEYRAAHPELKVYDLSYRELAADPVKAVRGIYENFGIEFRPQSEAGIRRWLAENPADKHGRHTYRLEDYGLTAARRTGRVRTLHGCLSRLHVGPAAAWRFYEGNHGRRYRRHRIGAVA